MPVTHQPPASRSLRIFVLEDHEDTRAILQRHLEGRGHEVCTARSLREATVEIRRREFDVLLCDIGLTDGLGWHFLESLHFTKPVLAIAISGAREPEDVRRSMEAGFRHHLAKPFDFAELDQILAQARVGGNSPGTRTSIFE